jgi:peptidyl-prolyl cis-trans isomerase C
MVLKFKSFFNHLYTKIKISWIKYWALQRRFAFDHSSISFQKAFMFFVTVVLLLYFVIGLPILGYYVYVKRSGGVPLAIASVLYPFPVATVGGDVILLKPYSDRLRYLTFFAKQTQQSLPSEAELRAQVINKLVDESVIRQWAKKDGIVVTRDDIDSAYNKIIKDRGSENEVQTVLSQLYNLDNAEFKRLIPDLLYREKIERQLLERVHVKHILVSTEATAKKIRGQVTPENFDAKAKEFSEDKASRDAGGDLGFFDRSRAEKLSPELKTVFFDTPVRQITDPVRTQYGYHIIFIVEKTGKEPKTFTQWLDEKRNQTKVRKFLK